MGTTPWLRRIVFTAIGVLLLLANVCFAQDSDGDGHTDEEEGKLSNQPIVAGDFGYAGWPRPSCEGRSTSNYFSQIADHKTGFSFHGGGKRCGSTGYILVSNLVPGQAVTYRVDISNYYRCNSSNRMKFTVSDNGGTNISVSTGSGCEYQGKSKRLVRTVTVRPKGTSLKIDVSLVTTSGSSSEPPVFATHINTFQKLGSVAADTDKDGVEDHLDLDSDNDGIPDRRESAKDRIIPSTIRPI